MYRLHAIEFNWSYVFFFQAEDGIRDVAVTGVQTCALPISLRPTTRPLVWPKHVTIRVRVTGLQGGAGWAKATRSEEHTSELQSRLHLVCRLLLEKKKKTSITHCYSHSNHMFSAHERSRHSAHRLDYTR